MPLALSGLLPQTAACSGQPTATEAPTDPAGRGLSTVLFLGDSVAVGSPRRAGVFDAGAVWGNTYQRTRDDTPDRSTDGVHTCP